MVGGYSSTFGREDDKIPHASSRFFYHADHGWSRDEPQPGSLFQRLREAEKRDPGNEVALSLCLENGVMMTPKRRLSTQIFACLC